MIVELAAVLLGANYYIFHTAGLHISITSYLFNQFQPLNFS